MQFVDLSSEWIPQRVDCDCCGLPMQFIGLSLYTCEQCPSDCDGKHAADFGGEGPTGCMDDGVPQDSSLKAAESFTSEGGILIHRATFLVCDPCVKLEGEECHTPECVFCFQSVSVARAVLNKTLNCPIINGERLILLGGDSTQDTNSLASSGTSLARSS